MADKKAAMKKPVNSKQAMALADFLKKGGSKAPAKAPVQKAAPAAPAMPMVADADEDEE